MPHIAAMDLFVVPTISFVQLNVLVTVRLARRELVSVNVTAHPTAGWIAQQLTEAFSWNEAPRSGWDLRCCGHAPITSHGIRDKPVAPSSPRQNAYAEGLIGTIRRECRLLCAEDRERIRQPRGTRRGAGTREKMSVFTTCFFCEP